jgi:hypothetical protein
MASLRRRAPVLLALVSVLIWLLADAENVRAAVSEGAALCAQALLPALFPFLAVASLLVSLGFGEAAARVLGRPFRALYGIGGAGAAAVVLGLAGGYPVGARTAAQLQESGLLSREESERLLAFCNNANPAFFLSVLGRGVFGSLRAGLCLWGVHVLSALLTGLAVCRRSPALPRSERRAPLRAVRLSAAVTGAVRSALESALGICAFVTFFSVLTLPLRDLPGLAGTALCGAAELFSAVPRLPPDRAGFVLASALAGWGGLCVHCQTAAALTGCPLSLRRYLPGKALQALLATALAAAAAPWALG